MSTAEHSLTIEYTDAQGQVQRTEHLQGAHFTLRVQSDALAVVSAPAQPVRETTPALPHGAWHRLTPWAWAITLFGVFALLTALEQWIEYNPDNATQNHVMTALGLIGSVALWAALWAVLGKIFNKHAHFWSHVCMVLVAGIALTVLMGAMHLLSFSLSWRVLGRMDKLSAVAALGLLVWAHLSLILPAGRTSALRIGMVSFTVVSVALMMWTNHRRSGTVLDSHHSSHLYRPALQLSSPQASKDFFELTKNMEASLKSRAAEIEAGEDGIGGGDED
jgi:hypothetical protein